MIDRLRVLKAKICDPFALCDFMGNHEREVLVAQTIHAAVNNFEQHGAAFSFVGANARVDHDYGPKNGEAYDRLVGNSYFEEGAFDGRPTIIPTEKLVLKLEGFFARNQTNA